MSADLLRARILVIWIAGVVLSYLLLISGVLFGSRDLTYPNIGDSARDLAAVVAPTLLMLLTHYFVAKPTPGQTYIALILSAVYVAAFTAITAAVAFWLDVDQPGNHQYAAINHFSWLSPWQPLVVGPTFYIFGITRAGGRQRARKSAAKDEVSQP